MPEKRSGALAIWRAASARGRCPWGCWPQTALQVPLDAAGRGGRGSGLEAGLVDIAGSLSKPPGSTWPLPCVTRSRAPVHCSFPPPRVPHAKPRASGRAVLNRDFVARQEGHQEGGEEHHCHVVQQEFHRPQRRQPGDPRFCHVPRGEAPLCSLGLLTTQVCRLRTTGLPALSLCSGWRCIPSSQGAGRVPALPVTVTMCAWPARRAPNPGSSGLRAAPQSGPGMKDDLENFLAQLESSACSEANISLAFRARNCFQKVSQLWHCWLCAQPALPLAGAPGILWWRGECPLGFQCAVHVEPTAAALPCQAHDGTK